MTGYLRTGLAALAITLMLALVFASTPTASAQPRDCWTKEIGPETETVTNPFTGMPMEVPVIKGGYDESCNRIEDGRVNNLDRASQAAIYCTDYGVDIYDLDWSGKGTFLFRSTFNEIEKVPEKPEVNTLIEGAPGFALYRLTSGELQLNGPSDWEGKPWVFIWEGCSRPEPAE